MLGVLKATKGDFSRFCFSLENTAPVLALFMLCTRAVLGTVSHVNRPVLYITSNVLSRRKRRKSAHNDRFRLPSFVLCCSACHLISIAGYFLHRSDLVRLHRYVLQQSEPYNPPQSSSSHSRY